MLKRESRNTTNIMKRTKWKRYVYVRDVQGNIRAVVGEDNAVAEQTDYYPYGMPMADVNSASAQPLPTSPYPQTTACFPESITSSARLIPSVSE